MRKAINFFRSYFEVAKELNDKDRLAFYDALLNKQFENIEPNLKGMANFAYISQKHSIDAQVKGYFDKTKDEQFNPTQPPKVAPKEPPYLQEKGQEKEKEQEKVEVQVVGKKIQLREFVYITQTNLNKLYSEFLEHEVNWMLDKLNDYKASTGKKYKCDYSAINVWVKDAFRKAKVDFIKDNNTHNVRMQIIQNEINNTDWNNL